ncbi:GntR family transcriptional regulator [Brevundimonas sp. BH3]|uniref:GntR family transcriptional regulator n=1 Tax=Brevundimonas sp. BH3 TaxID=3133089 RepID=UPI003243C1A7
MTDQNKAPEGAGSRPEPRLRGVSSDGSKRAIPVYHQLRSILRQQIKDGLFATDKPMPSEMQLSSCYGVSRVTVRRALEILESEGLIVRRHGVGTFVASDLTRLQNPAGPAVSGLVENLISMGMATTAELLEFNADMAPPTRVLQALGLQPDDTVLRLVRLRRHQNLPLSVSTVYLPHSVSHLAAEHLLDDRPVIRMLEEGGVRPYRAEQTLSAVPADDQVANWLGVAVSSPVIRLRRTILNDKNEPLEHYIGLYNPDHYEYHMMLTRDNSASQPQWRHIG